MSTAESIVRDYHQRTYHRFEAYAAGPATLDWDAQPDAFRRFEGCLITELPLSADSLATPMKELGQAPAQRFDAIHLGILLELSFAISAWKAYAGDSWALRCNPSSGNLHPTEAYIIPFGVDGMEPAIYHYRADLHGLEARCSLSQAAEREGVLIALSSVHWREAWKYGERAFRYSQLDTGHAIAALHYAASALGWRCSLLRDWGSADIATLAGLDRAGDFINVERESAEALLWIHTDSTSPNKEALLDTVRNETWKGIANLLDPRPLYDWPVIDSVDRATEIPPQPSVQTTTHTLPAPLPATSAKPAATIIRQRRSAQGFDPRATLPKDAFFRMLNAVLPHSGLPPWNDATGQTRIHLVLFVHRVEGLRQGLYAMPRHLDALEAMKDTMRPEFSWEKQETELPLYALVHADARRAARSLSCHQDIASDSAFAVAMLGEYDAAMSEGAWTYRQLFWEAGMVGQALYLDAEVAGVRGTGIGCYFDPAVHDTLGLEGTTFQSMYHFTVGTPLIDARLQTLPPYPKRQG